MTVWEALGTVAASFGVSTAASFMPIGGGVEVYLLATSALLPPAFVAPLVLASAAGSVAAKVVLYLGATKVRSPTFLEKGGRRAAIARKIQEGPWIRRGILFLSTTVSVPPYYAVTLAAGALRTPRTEFIVISLVGQTLRFGVVWAIPQLAGTIGTP